jgi:heterodisulfide reductase subunit C
MDSLGLIDELINHPAIWLCLGCGKCSDACSQLVEGRAMIHWIKDHAVQSGAVDYKFIRCLEQANKYAFNRWLGEVDALLDFNKVNPYCQETCM